MKRIILLFCTLCLVFAPVCAAWDNTTDYPVPEQSGSTILPPFFKLRSAKVNQTGEIVGTIKRVLQVNDTISIVLSHTSFRDATITNSAGSGLTETPKYYTPHLYKLTYSYNYETKEYTVNVEDIGFGGTGPDPALTTNYNFFSALSDIALTSDGYLVGCAHTRAYHNKYRVDDVTNHIDGSWTDDNGTSVGFGSGAMRVYRWAEKAAELKSSTNVTAKNGWFNLQAGAATAANNTNFHIAEFLRADIGYSMAWTGPLDGGVMTYTVVGAPFPTGVSDSEVGVPTEYAGLMITQPTLRFVHLQLSTSNTNVDVNFKSKKEILNGWVTKTADDLASELSITVDKNFLLHSSPQTNFPANVSSTTPPTKIDNPDNPTTKWVLSYDGGTKEFQQNGTSYEIANLATIVRWSEQKDVDASLHSYPSGFFRYAGKQLVVTPKADGQVELYNVTDGTLSATDAYTSENGKLIFTNTVAATTLSNVAASSYQTIIPQVDDADLTFFVYKGNEVTVLTMQNQEQARHIFAYGLDVRLQPETNLYEFSFAVNDAPYEAVLKIYQETTTGGGKTRTLMNDYKLIEAGEVTSFAVERGIEVKNARTNKKRAKLTRGNVLGSDTILYCVPCRELAGVNDLNPGSVLTWAIEVADTTVYNWSKLHQEVLQADRIGYDGSKRLEEGKSAYYVYNTVDKSTESRFFANIYHTDEYRGDNNVAHTGVWALNPATYAPLHKKVFQGSDNNSPDTGIRIPMRPAVDSTGVLYIPSYRDTYANVLMIDPQHVINDDKVNFSKFFTYLSMLKTTDKNYTNRPSGLAITGTGDKSKLLMYVGVDREIDNNKWIQTYDVTAGAMTSAGDYTVKKDVEIPQAFEKRHYDLVKGSIIPTKNGFFLAKVGDERGENKEAVSLLQYVYNADGTINTTPVYASANVKGSPNAYNDIHILKGGAATVTNDGQYLIVANTTAPGDKINTGNEDRPEFIVYELAADGLMTQTTPVKYKKFHDVSGIYHANFNYREYDKDIDDESERKYIWNFLKNPVDPEKDTKEAKVERNGHRENDYYTIPDSINKWIEEKKISAGQVSKFSKKNDDPDGEIIATHVIADVVNKANIRQMNFDYGGNLIATGRYGFFTVYAMPEVGVAETTGLTLDATDEFANRRETPAQSVLTIEVCDNYDRVFTNAGGDGKWENEKNWLPNVSVPYPHHRVRIDANVTVNDRTATAGYVDVLRDGRHNPTITVAPAGGLTIGGNTVYDPDYTVQANDDTRKVEGRISSVPVANQIGTTPQEILEFQNPTLRTDRNKTSATSTTKDALLTVENIIIKADEKGQGSLALHNQTVSVVKDASGTVTSSATTTGGAANTLATVELRGRYAFNPTGDDSNDPTLGNLLTWQYIGIPLDDPNSTEWDVKEAGQFFTNTWMYQWETDSSYWKILSGWGHSLEAWRGYLLTQPEQRTYKLTGLLQSTADKTIAWTRSTLSEIEERPTTDKTNKFQNANFLANSWTAPIQIDQFDDTDFEYCEPTIYLYAPTKRKYIALPFNTANYVVSSPYITTKDNTRALINPMQGFFVLATDANAKLHLNYAKLVATTEQPEYISDATLDSWAGDAYNENLSQPLPVHRAQAVEDVAEEPPVMHIYIRGNDGTVDNVVLIQRAEYTLDFDRGSDGRKIDGDAALPYLTAASNDGDMAVLATPSIYGTFLNFRKGQAKEYTVTFNYNVEETDLVLLDLVTKESVEIVSGNTYTFTTTEEEVATRFRISHREDSKVEYEPTAYVANNSLYLENPTNQLIGVAVFTVDGKLVQRFSTREALTQLNVPTQGLYLIEVTMDDKVITMKQIL